MILELMRRRAEKAEAELAKREQVLADWSISIGKLETDKQRLEADLVAERKENKYLNWQLRQLTKALAREQQGQERGREGGEHE